MTDTRCVLIGNTFANIMQIVIGFVSIMILFCHKILIENDIFKLKYKIFKNYKEEINEKRNWNIWIMDNTKQGVSSALAHIYATYLAVVYSNGEEQIDDECAWFLAQFLVDTVIGVLLSFGISRFTVFIINRCLPKFGRNWLIIGNYNTLGVKRRYSVWLFQVFHWILCSMIARVVCSILILITLSVWKRFNIAFSNIWIDHRYRELVFVVIGMPILLNSIQFLLTNWYLHWRRPKINSFLVQPLHSNIYY